MYKNKNIIDCHIHYALPIEPCEVIKTMDATGIDRANLVIVPHRNRLSSVPDALMVKDLYPKRIFVFASLDISGYFAHRNQLGKYFAKHAQQMRLCGCDGIKIVEGKPSMRKMLPIPDFDLETWDPFWEYAEKTGTPILWHVNDPQEFWDKDKIPAWALEKGWYYGEDKLACEAQYTQVLNILKRHPHIKIIFAHFFFLSGQLERLSTILDQYQNVMVDLTPGIEMYINFAKDPQASRNFFEKYQDRIIYGTDIGARNILKKDASDGINLAESRERSNLVRSFLTDSRVVTVKADGNFLIGTTDFDLQGIGLNESIQEKIFSKNFLHFIGEQPQLVDSRRVLRECRKIKRTLNIMKWFDKGLFPDFSAVNRVISYFKEKKAPKKI